VAVAFLEPLAGRNWSSRIPGRDFTVASGPPETAKLVVALRAAA